SYRLARGAYEVMSQGDTSDKLLFVSNMIWTGLAARFGLPIVPIQPLVIAVSEFDYTAADYLLACFGLRDPLMMLNCYDPVTGATYTSSERLDAVTGMVGGSEITPLVNLGEGCLPASTLVWTPEGPCPIAELWPGQQVI